MGTDRPGKSGSLVLRQSTEASGQSSCQTIHHTQLPEDSSDGQLTKEWNFYRHVVGRLLAEGHEGKWVLIKGEEIVGIWNTMDEADSVRLEKFLMQSGSDENKSLQMNQCSEEGGTSADGVDTFPITHNGLEVDVAVNLEVAAADVSLAV